MKYSQILLAYLGGLAYCFTVSYGNDPNQPPRHTQGGISGEQQTNQGDYVAEPGWYPNPHNPNQLMYFDGWKYTGHVHQVGSAGNFSTWVSASFDGVKRSALHVGLMLVIATVVLTALMMGLFFVFLKRVVQAEDLDDYSVFFTALTYIAVAVFICQMVLWWLDLAATRYLQFVHQNRRISVGEALIHALKRLPVAFLNGLVVLIGFLIFYLLGTGLFSVLFFQTVRESASGTILITLLAMCIFTAVGVFSGVKLFFFNVAAVATESPWRTLPASFAVSKGRFWAILGRVLFAVFVSFLIAYAGSIVASQITFLNAVNTINPEDIDSERFESGLFLLDVIREMTKAGVKGFILAGILNGLFSALSRIWMISATVRAYLDAGGEAT